MNKDYFNISLTFPLFFSFLKVGLVSFGGGYAMIGILKEEVVERKKWLTKEEFIEVIAIAEITPGPIAINTSTFVGYKIGGFWGAIFATTGVVLPSFTIILIIAIFSAKFLENRFVKNFMYGVILAIVAQLAKVSINFIKSFKKTAFTISVFLASLICTLFLNVSIFYIILVSGIMGILLARN